MSRISFFASIIAVAFSSAANAGIIQLHSDKSTFLGLDGVSSITGAIPASGGGTSLTIGDVTFSTALDPLAISIALGNRSTLIAGNEIAISGSESLGLALNLADPAFALGFDFHEPSVTGTSTNGTNTPYFHDSTFTIELLLGSSLVDTTLFTPNNDELVFFGVVSDMAFDTVRIFEDAGGLVSGYPHDINNDNEFYGQFYASTIAPVPEPSIYALFGIGLIGLGLARRRKVQA